MNEQDEPIEPETLLKLYPELVHIQGLEDIQYGIAILRDEDFRVYVNPNTDAICIVDGVTLYNFNLIDKTLDVPFYKAKKILEKFLSRIHLLRKSANLNFSDFEWILFNYEFYEKMPIIEDTEGIELYDLSFPVSGR